MSDKSGYTKKESDWLGREKEVHYNSDGQKTGETKFTEDWRGRSKQEHYNSSGDKTGETRKGSDWLGRERAEHYGNDGERAGYSKNEEDWLGNPVQRHYDTSGNKVGETRREEDWRGRARKEHRGTYYKSGASVHDTKKEERSSDSQNSSLTQLGDSSLGKALLILSVGVVLVLGVIKIVKEIAATQPYRRQPSVSIKFGADPKPKLPERVYCKDAQPILLTVPNKDVSIKLRKDCWTGGVDDPAKIGNGFFESSTNSNSTYIVQCSNEKELSDRGYMQAYQYMDCEPPMYYKATDKALILKVRIWKPF